MMLCNGCFVETVDASPTFYGRCLLEVKKKKYINGPCTITMDHAYGNGGFTMESKPLAYFANITVTGEGSVRPIGINTKVPRLQTCHWAVSFGKMLVGKTRSRKYALGSRFKGNGEDRPPTGLANKALTVN